MRPPDRDRKPAGLVSPAAMLIAVAILVGEAVRLFAITSGIDNNAGVIPLGCLVTAACLGVLVIPVARGMALAKIAAGGILAVTAAAGMVYVLKSGGGSNVEAIGLTLSSAIAAVFLPTAG